MWRFDIINHLIKKNKYTKYLEIGVEDGDCLRRIECETKHSCDPASDHASHKVTSDDFFASLAPEDKYDIVFVDGLHTEEQAFKDVSNALSHLSPNGTVVMHDCNPPSEWHQRSYEEAQKNGCRLWNGTVWRAYVKLRTERDDIETAVVDTDWGVGLVRFSKVSGQQSKLDMDMSKLTYNDLHTRRAELLNLVSPEEFTLRY